METTCKTFGILLPITGRTANGGFSLGVLSHLTRFAESLCLSQNVDAGCRAKVYVGIDHDDVLGGYKKEIRDIFTKCGCRSQDLQIVSDYTFERGAVCHIARDLAQKAFEDGCDYYVLLGDDIEIQSPTWMGDFCNAFDELASETGLPQGFGVVCFKDVSFPGFPTFPVVSKLHFDIFGELYPIDFVNQDADPFMFFIYRNFGAGKMLYETKLTNQIGGSFEPRYRKRHVSWRFEMQQTAVNKLVAYLEKNKYDPNEYLYDTIDVVTPSYRCEMKNIKAITSMEIPSKCSTMFIVIGDDPDCTNLQEVISYFEQPRKSGIWDLSVNYRFRYNKKNSGASFSRNRGMNESAAKWIVFLDDDVMPNSDTLIQYHHKIRLEGNESAGFVGLTTFPYPKSLYTKAVTMSDLTYYWRICTITDKPAWGVTANLAVRNIKTIRFKLCFPKTGGGEDVDVCLRLQEYLGKPLRSAPAATVTHPWWNNGQRDYLHFYGWSVGDSNLVDMFPEFTYRAAPNLWETLILLIMFSLLRASYTVLTGAALSWQDVARFYILKLFLQSVSVIGTEVFNVVYRQFTDRSRIRECTGLVRLIAAAESFIVVYSCELGHLTGHLFRGNFHNVCKKFDWFAGRSIGAIKQEKGRAFNRFVTYLICFGAVEIFL